MTMPVEYWREALKVAEARIATLEALLRDTLKMHDDCLCRDRRKAFNAALSGARTAKPVSGAGQYCHLCRNVHDLMSACPPANAKGEGA